ncbi:MAG: hypothetical protein GYB37_12025 [Algicola sp.]|nr:hypothetical protein [Algicola sp.]
MNDGTVFLNQQHFWPVILAGVLLWSVFIWKEWEQRKQSRFWIKLATSFFAVLSLMLILLKPATWQEFIGGKGIIITEGYRPDQLDSLKSTYKRIRTEEYSAGKALVIAKDLDSLFLLGHGVETFDLWQLKEKSIAFLGGQQLSGWAKVSHQNTIQLGEILQVDAKYSNPKSGHWVVLADNGGNPLDSISFEDGQEQLIQLVARPKASGQFVYRLLEKDEANNIISEEPIPIQILAGEPLKVLMLNTFPTFESKYLKNFLAEKGHEVVSRTQLTKGKYKFEYFNGATNPVYRLTEQILKSYDLLIIDTESYTDLGTAGRKTLEESVNKHGLGVFIQPGESTFSLPASRNPFQFKRDFINEIALGGSSITIQKHPFDFQMDLRTYPIWMDSTSVGAYVAMEKGKIGTSLLQNTYQLILEGEAELYADIWTQIVNNMAREEQKEVKWTSLNTIPRIDQPFDFELRTSIKNVAVSSTEGANIPLLQDVLVPSKWTSTHYPRYHGWNELKISNDSLDSYTYFVFDNNQYRTVASIKKLEANLREFDSESTFKTTTSETRRTLKPISSIWFYVIFLLCLGWLWLEPKLVG